MASPTDFAVKHGVATAGAIPSTIATAWYLETLNVAGVALVFVLFLALFNLAASFIPTRKSG